MSDKELARNWHSRVAQGVFVNNSIMIGAVYRELSRLWKRDVQKVEQDRRRRARLKAKLAKKG